MISYFAAAEVGHALSFPGDFSSFWPPSGVYLAALLVNRCCCWPLVAATALLGNLASDVGFHDKTAIVSLGFWAANTVAAFLTAATICRVGGPSFDIDRVRSVVWLTATTALVGAVVGALLGAAVVVASFGGSYWRLVPLWWISGLLGVLIVTPALVHYARRRPWREPGWTNWALEAAAVAVTTAGFAEFVFGRQGDPMSFIINPVLVWASIRLQVGGAVLATTILTTIAVWHTTHGRGPFAIGRPIEEQVLLTQGFLGVSILLSLVLAALRTERQAEAAAAAAARRELEEANAELQRLAETDPLTGLSNRRAFQRQLTEEVERAARYQAPLSVLLIDVDHFKAFNDQFGHPAGDAVLRALGRILRKAGRGLDCVARYGGEEFAVLLPNTDREGAMAAAERMRQMVEQNDWPHRAVTISLGVATAGPSAADGPSLVRLADLALYRSKGDGRNRSTHALSLTDAAAGQAG